MGLPHVWMIYNGTSYDENVFSTPLAAQLRSRQRLMEAVAASVANFQPTVEPATGLHRG